MDQFAPVSIDTSTPQDQQPVSVDTGTSDLPLSPEIASLRAAKAQYGLGDRVAKNYGEFYQAFISGQEQPVRQEVTANLHFQKSLALQKAITDVAGKKGGPLTPEESDYVRTLVANYKPPTPESVIEEAYTAKAIDQLYSMMGRGSPSTDERPHTFLEDAMTEIPPGEFDKVFSTGKQYSSNIEYAKTLRQNVQADIDNQSYIGWGADQAKNLFQLYQEYKLRGNVPIDVFGGLGTSKEAQAIALLRIGLNDPEAYRKKLKDITDYLRKDNPTLAGEFLDGVIGQSTTKETLDNVFTLLAIPDITSIAKGGASLARKAFLYNQTKTAVKDVVKGLDAVAQQPIKVAVADSVGDLSEAAVQKATANILSSMDNASVGAKSAAKEAIEALPDIMKADVKDIAANPGRFGQEIVNRLTESYNTFTKGFLETVANVAKVQRITPALATEDAVRAIKEEIKDRYPGLSNSILNVSSIYHNPIANTYHADLIIGKPGGEFWLQKQAAKNYAENVIGFKDYELKQKGLGWYISIPQPVNETTHAVRDFLTATKASQSPDSWVNAFAGWLRTPEETLALEQLKNRKIATYAPSVLMKVAKETADEIRAISRFTLPGTARRERWKEWERTVKYAQDATDPNFIGPTRPGDVQKGYFFKSPGELEAFYQQNFKRLPEEGEIKAYFAFKRLGEMDHAMRNISIYRNMSRVGALDHAISVLDAGGKKLTSGFFPAVLRNKMPRGEDAILVATGEHGTEKLAYGTKIATKERKELEQGIKEGKYKVLEIYDPDLKPLQSFSPVIKDERIRWVIAKNTESKNLDYNNLPYKGGGHFEYDYSHYIKQAKVNREKIGGSVRDIYTGDTTVMPIALRAMGHDVAAKLNEARRLIANKDIARAKQYVADNLPFEWKELNSWFRPSKDPHGNLLPARLSLTEPFHVVERNKRIVDLDKTLEKRYSVRGVDTFVDGTRSGSLARQHTVQYTGERDAFNVFTVNNKGSAAKPLYEIGDAKLLDPIPTMNRALSRITNSMFMDDYKVSAIEHWLKEAAPYMKAETSDIMHSPFWHFNNVAEGSWKPAAPIEKIKQLTTQLMQIKQFTGTPSSTDALLHSVAQKLADSIYSKFGPDGLKIPGTGIKISPLWLVDRVDHPVQAIRALTFHAKLGLFALPQLMVQTQTFVTIAGVAGMSKAGPGAYAVLLHNWANVNPRLLETLDKYASKLAIPGMSRWKPGEFKEAYTELKNTGFAHVGGEYALRDDMYSAKVIGTGTKQFLDAGAYFFSKGERTVREGAWYTAYREFREANPTGRLTADNRRDILQRATLLNVNMDRSSNSILQHGAFSIPMQFLTYQVRAAELMLGKRITGYERARLMGTYAMMYGVPGAIGATGLPFGENMRKSAIDHGYVVGDNWLTTLMEGIPSTILGIATGGGDPRQGSYYNIGTRLGPGGFDPLKEIFSGDKNFLEIMGGAAYSTLANTFTASDGFRTAMMAMIRGDKNVFPVTSADFVDIFKEISSVQNTWRLIAAINTGKWLSKKETETTDVSAASAIFMSITGLQPQQVSDLHPMQLTRKDEKEYQKYILNKFTEEMGRGFRSQDSDPKQARVFFARAGAWLDIGGYPEEDRAKAYGIAMKGNETVIQRSNYDYYLKGVPEDKKDRRMKAYQKQLRMEGH